VAASWFRVVAVSNTSNDGRVLKYIYIYKGEDKLWRQVGKGRCCIKYKQRCESAEASAEDERWEGIKDKRYSDVRKL
jgi:hypothetical protein